MATMGTPGAQQGNVKKGRGCFFYGCLTSIVILVLAAAAVTLGFYWLQNRVSGYLDNAPRAVPVEKVTDQEYASLRNEVEGFLSAAREGRPASLTLNAHQINALIARHEMFQALRDRVHVKIKDGGIIAEISLAARDLGWPSDKYINGSLIAWAGMQYRRPFLRISELEMNGKKLPELIAKSLNEKNLLEVKSADQHREAAELISRIDNIGVQNGRLSIALRGGEPIGVPAPEGKPSA